MFSIAPSQRTRGIVEYHIPRAFVKPLKLERYDDTTDPDKHVEHLDIVLDYRHDLVQRPTRQLYRLMGRALQRIHFSFHCEAEAVEDHGGLEHCRPGQERNTEGVR